MTDTLPDAIHRTTGGPTNVDGTHAYYLANGATSANRTDAEYEFLAAQGFLDGDINDRWWAYLDSLGYQGDLNDRLYLFWSQTEPPPPPPRIFPRPTDTFGVQVLRADFQGWTLTPSIDLSDLAEGEPARILTGVALDPARSRGDIWRGAAGAAGARIEAPDKLIVAGLTYTYAGSFSNTRVELEFLIARQAGGSWDIEVLVDSVSLGSQTAISASGAEAFDVTRLQGSDQFDVGGLVMYHFQVQRGDNETPSIVSRYYLLDGTPSTAPAQQVGDSPARTAAIPQIERLHWRWTDSPPPGPIIFPRPGDLLGLVPLDRTWQGYSLVPTIDASTLAIGEELRILFGAGLLSPFPDGIVWEGGVGSYAAFVAPNFITVGSLSFTAPSSLVDARVEVEVRVVRQVDLTWDVTVSVNDVGIGTQNMPDIEGQGVFAISRVGGSALFPLAGVQVDHFQARRGNPLDPAILARMWMEEGEGSGTTSGEVGDVPSVITGTISGVAETDYVWSNWTPPSEILLPRPTDTLGLQTLLPVWNGVSLSPTIDLSTLANGDEARILFGVTLLTGETMGVVWSPAGLTPSVHLVAPSNIGVGSLDYTYPGAIVGLRLEVEMLIQRIAGDWSIQVIANGNDLGTQTLGSAEGEALFNIANLCADGALMPGGVQLDHIQVREGNLSSVVEVSRLFIDEGSPSGTTAGEAGDDNARTGTMQALENVAWRWTDSPSPPPTTLAPRSADTLGTMALRDTYRGTELSPALNLGNLIRREPLKVLMGVEMQADFDSACVWVGASATDGLFLEGSGATLPNRLVLGGQAWNLLAPPYRLRLELELDISREADGSFTVDATVNSQALGSINIASVAGQNALNITRLGGTLGADVAACRIDHFQYERGSTAGQSEMSRFHVEEGTPSLTTAAEPGGVNSPIATMQGAAPVEWQWSDRAPPGGAWQPADIGGQNGVVVGVGTIDVVNDLTAGQIIAQWTGAAAGDNVVTLAWANLGCEGQIRVVATPSGAELVAPFAVTPMSPVTWNATIPGGDTGWRMEVPAGQTLKRGYGLNGTIDQQLPGGLWQPSNWTQVGCEVQTNPDQLFYASDPGVNFQILEWVGPSLSGNRVRWSYTPNFAGAAPDDALRDILIRSRPADTLLVRIYHRQDQLFDYTFDVPAVDTHFIVRHGPWGSGWASTGALENVIFEDQGTSP